jgi:hypothetical protein
MLHDQCFDFGNIIAEIIGKNIIVKKLAKILSPNFFQKYYHFWLKIQHAQQAIITALLKKISDLLLKSRPKILFII